MAMKKRKKHPVPKGIKGISDATKNRSHLFYGKSGTGKTTLAASFPGPALLIDIGDFGTDSIPDFDGKVIEALDWDAIEEVYWYLASGDHPYKTVILDTITQLLEVIRRKIAGKKTQLTLKMHGDVSTHMKTWLMHFRDLDMETVFLGQERVFDNDEEESDDEIQPYVGPAVSPGIVAFLPGNVNMIGNTFIQTKRVKVKGRTIKSKVYSLRLGPHESHLTKVRKSKSLTIPAVLEDPDYSKLVAITKENKSGKTKKRK